MSHAASSFDFATVTPTMREGKASSPHWSLWYPNSTLENLESHKSWSLPPKPAEPASPNELEAQPSSQQRVAEQGGR